MTNKRARKFYPGDVLANVGDHLLLRYDVWQYGIDTGFEFNKGDWFRPFSMFVVSVMPHITAHGTCCLCFVLTDAGAGWVFIPNTAKTVVRAKKNG